jgi:23S rRNA (adenine2503-C2)-methyltransferase
LVKLVGVTAPPPSLADIRQRLHALGANHDHVAHLLRAWLHARPFDTGRRRLEHFLPRRVRDALPALASELAACASLHAEYPATDCSARMLVALHDGQTVEAVLLPPRDGARGAHGLCVSAQVGCAVGCTFCKTGEGGLARQMGSAEIAAQLALARTRRAVNKVVFMGMGEPAHNLDAVLEAIDAMGREGGIGHKNLVLSTVGDARLFERLAALGPGDVRPALALSLHTTSDAKRAALLPRAPRIAVAALVDEAERYARASGYPLQIQWTLIDGVNDGDDEVDALIALLRGRLAVLNMIPFNRIDGSAYRRPLQARIDAIFHALNRRGVLTRMRQSAGQDVDAGCGQLRSRALGQAQVVTMRARVVTPLADRASGCTSPLAE